MNKIELIFNMYKDKVLRAKPFRHDIKTKYKLSDREISDIYAKISNYQEQKYGARLETGKLIELLSRNECKKRAKKVYSNKRERIIKRERNYE